jgi:hypothetical protein
MAQQQQQQQQVVPPLWRLECPSLGLEYRWSGGAHGTAAAAAAAAGGATPMEA